MEVPSGFHNPKPNPNPNYSYQNLVGGKKVQFFTSCQLFHSMRKSVEESLRKKRDINIL
jgi:hypothetical protein